MPYLLHVYDPAGRHGSAQAETWAALAEIEPALSLCGWVVEHVPTGPGDEYERAIRDRWGRGRDIIVCEHDIVPTAKMLFDLAACPDELCAQAYRLHFSSDTVAAVNRAFELIPRLSAEDRALVESHMDLAWLREFANQKRPDMNGTCWEPFCHRVSEDGRVRWGSVGDERGTWVGLGLTKIAVTFQRRHPDGWEWGAWNDLDGRICNWVLKLGYDWHMHRPEVKHNHPHGAGYWVGEPIGIGRQTVPPRPSRWSARSVLPGAQQVPEEMERMVSMVAERRPHVVLEIGSAEGGTLAAWADAAAEDALLVSVDTGTVPPIPHGPNQQVLYVRGDSHDAATLTKVIEVLPTRWKRPVDFLFIDGDHSLEGVRQDFEMYAPLVRVGGIVALHDICHHSDEGQGRVDEFWSEVSASHPHQEIREIIADSGQGWAGIGVIFVSDNVLAALAAQEA